jgi:hypothetical protein
MQNPVFIAASAAGVKVERFGLRLSPHAPAGRKNRKETVTRRSAIRMHGVALPGTRLAFPAGQGPESASFPGRCVTVLAGLRFNQDAVQPA